MTDPSDGMKSFQQELRRGDIAIHISKTDANLFVHVDAPNGPPEYRFTYVRLKGKTVTAMVMFAAQPPEDRNHILLLGTRYLRGSKSGDVRKIFLLRPLPTCRLP